MGMDVRCAVGRNAKSLRWGVAAQAFCAACGGSSCHFFEIIRESRRAIHPNKSSTSESACVSIEPAATGGSDHDVEYSWTQQNCQGK
eukprot:scaffold5535_cov180-Amphora_coffeaeformis.AAC.7